MTSRRNFLTQLTKGVGGIMLPAFFKTPQGQALLTSINRTDDVTQDEDFWRQIQQAYTSSAGLLDLNNGGVSPQPRVVQEAVEHYNRLSNDAPSYYMWRILDKGKATIRKKLAKLGHCSEEEIAINRNATEALETVIFGLQLEKGDEVVLSKYDYPNVMNAWRQREQRDGIVLKWVDLPLPSEDAAALAKPYIEAFTNRTKLVQITHVLNWSGQILPVQRIAKVAKAQGIEVLVDGAQSFAQFDFSIPDLGCDYFGTSLHKWLCAPFGTGMLYVRKPKIAALYPLFAAPQADSDDIRKFENIGTRSVAIEQGIGQAIHFHNMIGITRKTKRLHYLNQYWRAQLDGFENIHFYTPKSSDFSCALVLVNVAGKELSEIVRYLYNQHQIHVTNTNHEALKGIRVSPNIYTLTEDLDRLVLALKQLAKH